LTVASADAVQPEPPGERPDPRLGSVVAGSFRLLRRIGGGGMGDVYEAEQIRLGRRVAVKLLRRELVDSKETRLRFEREARLSAQIASEHVVAIVDCGELPDGSPFLAMELVHGEDLRSRLSRLGRLQIDETLGLILDACLGLAAVHRAGVLHRDLKPANLFVVESEEGPSRCKILDFGVAKALSASDTTRRGVMLGTLRYMAPEQVGSERALDARADIYSLGAILYECLAGRPLHDAETREELLAAIVYGSPVPIRERRAELPPCLDELVMRCLARDPDDRFPSADMLARELARREREIRVSEHTLADATLEHDRPRRGDKRDLAYGLIGLALGVVAGFWLSDQARAPVEASLSNATGSSAGKIAASAAPVTTLRAPSLAAPVGASSSPSVFGSAATNTRLLSPSAVVPRRKTRPIATENAPLLATPHGESRPSASAAAPADRLDSYLEVESPYEP
jgi:serine/threonine protein kinase